MWTPSWGMFDSRFSNRMGERVIPGGRNWDPLMPNVEVTRNYDDKLELDFEHQIRAMKWDSIPTAINTDFLSKVDSLNSAKSTRHDPVKTRKAEKNKIYTRERLGDIKIPSKTWDYVVSYTHLLRKGAIQTQVMTILITMSRQGEEWEFWQFSTRSRG